MPSLSGRCWAQLCAGACHLQWCEQPLVNSLRFRLGSEHRGQLFVAQQRTGRREHSPAMQQHNRLPGSSLRFGRHRWRANIRLGGKSVKLGSSSTAEEAAKVYDPGGKEEVGSVRPSQFP
jgi:hypothetical protein